MRKLRLEDWCRYDLEELKRRLVIEVDPRIQRSIDVYTRAGDETIDLKPHFAMIFNPNQNAVTAARFEAILRDMAVQMMTRLHNHSCQIRDLQIGPDAESLFEAMESDLPAISEPPAESTVPNNTNNRS